MAGQAGRDALAPSARCTCRARGGAGRRVQTLMVLRWSGGGNVRVVCIGPDAGGALSGGLPRAGPGRDAARGRPGPGGAVGALGDSAAGGGALSQE